MRASLGGSSPPPYPPPRWTPLPHIRSKVSGGSRETSKPNSFSSPSLQKPRTARQVSPGVHLGVIWESRVPASRFRCLAPKFRRVWAGLRGFLASPRVFVLLKVWAPLGLGVGLRAFRARLRRLGAGLRPFATGLQSLRAAFQGFGVSWIGVLLRWIQSLLKAPGLDVGLRLKAK